MKANGVDVIGFAAGEPDFPTPDYIKYAGMAAIVHDETRYTPATGTLALKKAVCKRLKEDLDLDYEPANIVCSSGAKHCLYIALRAIINPGDEVIIPTPAWVTYNEMVKMVGAEPVTIVCTEAENFKLTPEKLETAITDKTKCVMLNNPSNPTGMLYSKEELQGIADVCVKHDLFIIADEIYYKLLYDGREFTSIASLGEDVKELTIIINGVSKSYAMTGWRIGYIAADKRVVSVMSKYLSHSTGNPSAPAQAASVVALNAPQDTVEEMRKAFEKRRDYMVERMNQIPGVSCLKPEGAFYVMMNITQLIGKTLHGQVIRNADDFGDIFLKEGLVCIVPCTGFGDANFLRWSYATSMENIKEGLDRLEKFLAE
ncbi:MAG: pyridoxal phosphate-dependent aminotransferase [Oscillospiraceae bacterium]|nr:pyridoxal phosphate-dependent aminotransferase [Oscillospiraceae bacterium]